MALLVLLTSLWLVVLTGSSAVAQSLTESIQETRMTVLRVDRLAGRFLCSQHGWMAAPTAVVVRDDARKGDLALLKVGDVIRAEGKAGYIEKIIVLRHAADEITIPER